MKILSAIEATNLSNTNTGDQTLPVKASGSEADTATDDAKFLTAKAVKDSHNVPSIAPGTSGNVLTSNGTDWTSAAASGGGGSPSEYDQVIRTQAQFETLIASSTWLGAVSVCFIGDGGTLKFTRSDGTGILIPATVKQIQGINSATIEVTSFVYNSSTNKGGLWYATLPTTDDYSIKDLIVNCAGTGAHGYGYGFHSCTQIANCIGTGTCGDDYGYGYGFHSCTQITNCTGTCAGTGTYGQGYGFYSCIQLTNCTGTGTGASSGKGFYSCIQLTNCTGTGTGASSGYGFGACIQLTNCTGTGTGGSTGYGFYICHYLSNCKAGAASSQSLLGGSNTQVDDITVA